MQIRKVKKKPTIFLYFSVFFVAFILSYHNSSSANDVSITFSAKTAESGWVVEKSSDTDPSSAFATESSLLNALKITIEGGLDGGIKYTFHKSNGDWLPWAKDGQVSNADETTSFNAVKVSLYGNVSKRFNVLYRIKTKNDGWSEWVKNGAIAGDIASNDPIIGLQVACENTSPLAAIKKIVTNEEDVITDAEPETSIANDLKPISSAAPTALVGLQKLTKESKGIDVSYYNGDIDWAKVKAAGIEYAIIQVGYRGCTFGSLKNDSKFEKNIQGAIQNDIKVGIYFVTQAKNAKEAEEEADFVLKRISNYSIDYPVYIDIEDVKNSRQRKLNNAERTTVCKTFCDKIYSAGYETGIYSCQYYFESKLNTSELLDYNIWCAAYEIKNKPETNFPYQIWQASETGKVDGIKGNVDINYAYYDYVNYSRSATIAPSAEATTDTTTTGAVSNNANTQNPSTTASPAPNNNNTSLDEAYPSVG